MTYTQPIKFTFVLDVQSRPHSSGSQHQVAGIGGSFGTKRKTLRISIRAWTGWKSPGFYRNFKRE